MPILKIVAACEKVIYDLDGPVSLVGIFEGMKFRLQDAPLPDKAVAPNQWSIFTLWEPQIGELGKVFTQFTQVFAPDGSLFLENKHTFLTLEPERIQIRVRLNIKSLPIWQEGKVVIKVSLVGDEAELGSTCFNIVYIPKEDDSVITETPSA